MPKPKVFVTRTIPESGLRLLQQHCRVRIYPNDRTIPRKKLLKEIQDCDALLCLLTDNIDKELIDANPKLRLFLITPSALIILM